MTWFKVDDSFYDHPKVFDAPDCAVALWTRAGTWSARNLTDGFVPANLPARLCDDPDTAVRELTDRGLWRRAKGGYRFHDWTEFQPSAASVKDLRAKRAEAGKKGGQAKAAKQTASKPVASASTVGKQNPAPSRPGPSRPKGGGSVGEGESPTERAGDPPPPTLHTGPRPAERCDRHVDVTDPPNCGQCADHRRAAEAWDAEQPRRDAAVRSAEARRRAELRAAEVDACTMCDADGYAGVRVCDHDPHRADVAARGAAAARAALAERRTA